MRQLDDASEKFIFFAYHYCSLFLCLKVSSKQAWRLYAKIYAGKNWFYYLRSNTTDQEIDKQEIIDLQKELSEMKFDQKLCSMKLNQSLQELNSLNPKNIKRKIDRREQKISELTGVNDRLVKKLNESLLNEEKLIEEIKNSSLQSIKYQQEIDHLNKLLDGSLIWKTKYQKLKWYHKFAMERKSNKNEILGTSYDARISELKQQISILENEKCEVEEKLSLYMEGPIKTKENGHYYHDTVRATYQDLVMMGVGINNIEKVVRTVLTDFTNMNIECLPKATFARLTYTESRRLSQLQVAQSLLKDYDGSCRTLYADDTSKFGKHYGTYDVVIEQGQTLIAGIREVSSGVTETQLNVYLDISTEIEESLQGTEKNISNKIISSIKNIMPDRHIV